MPKGLLLIDSSIMLEYLQVPGKCNKNSGIPKQFDKLMSSGEYTLYLPIATVFETGRHISQLKKEDGNKRRKIAEYFIKRVKMAIEGRTPFKTLDWEAAEMSEWLDSYPDFAQASISLGDLSIIKQFEKLCGESPKDLPIKIWSIDKHLASYQRNWKEEK